MNNRKQKIFSLLDSLTQTELEQYIKEREINTNSEVLSMLNVMSRQRELNHLQNIASKIQGTVNDAFTNYYKLGQAQVISFVLECFYDKKYKIKDLQYYLKSMFEKDETLKEYVYEVMKDF